MRALILGAALTALAGSASAAELLLGAYGHDVTFIGDSLGLGAAGREDGVDFQVGVRSERLEGLRLIGRPQAHALVSLNSKNTSNFVAAGVSWPIAITEKLYFRPGVGLAYTDGQTKLPPVNAPGLSPAEIQRRLHLYNTRIDFGAQVLFQGELGLGYRFNDRWAGELSWVHISNGQVFASGKNQGMDDAGVRLIYRF